MLTDEELQSLRNLGNEAEAAVDEILALRFELQSAREVNLAVVRRLQGEVDRLTKALERSHQDEASAMYDLDRAREAEDYATNRYIAASGGG